MKVKRYDSLVSAVLYTAIAIIFLVLGLKDFGGFGTTYLIGAIIMALVSWYWIVKLRVMVRP